MGLTSAQRYNRRMDAIFEEAKKHGHDSLVGDSKMKGHGVHSPAMEKARKGFKNKALGKLKK